MGRLSSRFSISWSGITITWVGGTLTNGCGTFHGCEQIEHSTMYVCDAIVRTLRLLPLLLPVAGSIGRTNQDDPGSSPAAGLRRRDARDGSGPRRSCVDALLIRRFGVRVPGGPLSKTHHGVSTRWAVF